MTCFRPLKGFRTAAINPDTGRRGLTFNPLQAANSALPLMLPCGQCNGCRHDRAASWAIRLGHEARMHERSSFITLTYNDQNLPVDYSVKKRDWQLFMMRVRKRFGAGIRFYGCGEYGDVGGRPHYHGLLFGLDFTEDRKLWSKRGEHSVYRSAALEELWPFGQSELGSVTPGSAGYVARYCLKKMTGPRADDRYFRVSPVDGNRYRVETEFATMSRRPGIGSEWFNRFASDAFPSDFVIVDRRRKPVPGFYLRKLPDAKSVDAASIPAGRYLTELAAPAAERIKRKRKRSAAAPERKADRTPERLAVREEVHVARMSRLKRSL